MPKKGARVVAVSFKEGRTGWETPSPSGRLAARELQVRFAFLIDSNVEIRIGDECSRKKTARVMATSGVA